MCYYFPWEPLNHSCLEDEDSVLHGFTLNPVTEPSLLAAGEMTSAVLSELKSGCILNSSQLLDFRDFKFNHFKSHLIFLKKEFYKTYLEGNIFVNCVQCPCFGGVVSYQWQWLWAPFIWVAICNILPTSSSLLGPGSKWCCPRVTSDFLGLKQ